MPYRVDIPNVGYEALDRLIELGAIDADLSDQGIAALMPDNVAPEQIVRALGVDDVSVSPATERDAGSVWVLSPRPVRIGRLRLAPAHNNAEPGTLRLIDSAAFGTGLHPTTALCLEAIDEAVAVGHPDRILDVGTGSGVLALGALLMGVPRALGIDIDDAALRVAAENARLNALNRQMQWQRGGPETVLGTWPLVVANVLAAPLIEMAPALVRRVGSGGVLVLSGISSSLEQDVERTYLRLGMRRIRVRSRGGWVAVTMRASW